MTWRVAAVLIVALGAGCGRSPAGTRGDTSRSGCVAGQTPLMPRTLAQESFSAFAWDDGNVVATGLDGLTSFPADGSAPTALARIDGPYGLVLAGSSAYFTASIPAGAPDPQGKVSSAMALFSAPLAGGDATLMLNAPLNMDGALTDGVALYTPGYSNSVTRVSISDGARTDLALPNGLFIGSLALHAGTIYVAAQDLTSMSATNGVIVKLPATGGAMQTVVANIGPPRSLVADASGLTWVEEPPIGQFGDSHIVHAGLDGKGAKTLLAHGANSLAVSDGFLYIASTGISKLPLAGGDEVPLVTGLQDPGKLVVAGGNAAWLDPVVQALSATTPPSLMTVCW